MRSLTMATLCMAGLSQARHTRLQARMDYIECCPCPGSGQAGDGAMTVTVTVKAAPAETVYMTEHPKEVAAKPAVTVFVTAESNQPQPGDSSKEDTVNDNDDGAGEDGNGEDGLGSNGPGNSGAGNDNSTADNAAADDGSGDNGAGDDGADDNTSKGDKDSNEPSSVNGQGNAGDNGVTQDNGQDAADDGSDDKIDEQGGEQVVTEIIKPSPKPSTVTISLESTGDRTVPADRSSLAPSSPKVVTVTEVPTKSSDVPKKPEAAKKQASTITVTQNRDVTTRVVDKPSTVLVTAAPEVPAEASKDLEIVTQTVTDSHGDINVEITIININTGDAVCFMEDSGKPCENTSNIPPKQSECQPIEPSTSIATVFQTVTIAVDQQGVARNGTAAMGVAKPTGSAALMGRTPYAPRSQRFW